MSELLNHPAAQAALLPFVVALVLGFFLARTRFLAAAVLSGLVVVVSLTIGFSLEPLTAVKKLVISALTATAVSLAIEASGVAPRRAAVAALSVAAGAAAVWAISRVLQQMETAALWRLGLGAFAFVAATVAAAMVAGAKSSLRGALAGACLGWGSGVLALLGASALLAQIGLGVGTACAAVALVQMLRGSESPLGWTLVLPAAVTAAIVGVLASATGELPGYCLIPLPFAALVAWWSPVGAGRPVWQRAIVTGLLAAVPVAAAIGLAWRAATSPASS